MKHAFTIFSSSVLVYITVAACSGVTIESEPMAMGSNAGSSSVDDSGAPNSPNSILNPVPDAEAAEDGARIINRYITTEGGLKTLSGFWDTELDTACSFKRVLDGNVYCVPEMQGISTDTYLNATCTEVVVPLTCGSKFPKFLGVLQPDLCGSEYVPHYAKEKVNPTIIYRKIGDNCIEAAVNRDQNYFTIGPKLFNSALVQGEFSND